MSSRSLRSHASSIVLVMLAGRALGGCQGSDELTSARADSSADETGEQDSSPGPADARSDAHPDTTLDARPDAATDSALLDSARADTAADARLDAGDTADGAKIDAPDSSPGADTAPVDDTAPALDTAVDDTAPIVDTGSDDTAPAVDTSVDDTAPSLDTAIDDTAPAIDTAEACAVNACGGCGVLAGAPTTACGVCGTYTCSSDLSSVSCVEGPLNGCGVCGPEPTPPPRTACGSCGTGTTTCDPSGLTTTCMGGEPVSGTDFSFDPSGSATATYPQFGAPAAGAYAATYRARHTGSFTEVDLRVAQELGFGAVSVTVNLWQDTIGAGGTLLATLTEDQKFFPVFSAGSPPMHAFVFPAPTKPVTAGAPVFVELVFTGGRSSWVVASDTASPAPDYLGYQRYGTEPYAPTTYVPYMNTVMNACF